MAPSFDPGRVSLRLHLDGDRVAAAEAASVRPSVARALRGMEADRAVDLVPLLYSLCGKAQGVAARLALAAARGEATPLRREESVAREVAGEHLWRLLVDWPKILGLPAHEALFVEGRRRLAQADFSDWVGSRLDVPFARLLQALSAVAEAPATENRLLPDLDAAASLALWPRLEEAFAAAPTYRGSAAETGAFARRACGDTPLRARVRARMEELLAGAPGRVSAVPVAAGIGRALVDTARGPLMHELALDGGRIADYVVVAPTEWNFHPAGPLASWLGGLTAAAAEELAPRAVLALDPCVPWNLEMIRRP
jgi:hypothetical protein